MKNTLKGLLAGLSLTMIVWLIGLFVFQTFSHDVEFIVRNTYLVSIILPLVFLILVILRRKRIHESQRKRAVVTYATALAVVAIAGILLWTNYASVVDFFARNQFLIRLTVSILFVLYCIWIFLSWWKKRRKAKEKK
ncbi:MAG: hypothetical protein FWE10_01615 [Rikenellaceae bacterium]|nr:hypothetical protein [Rikenellaceae bacterium]MCL2692567.1 hypothetical protein [Rikenellaceae bacterium]